MNNRHPIEDDKALGKLARDMVADPDPELGYIWLQEDEDEGAAECGCKLTERTDDGRPAVFLCPLHSAAPDLAEALRGIIKARDEAARAALAKAGLQ